MATPPINAPSQLTQILLASQNQDKKLRKCAEQQLLAAEENNFEEYLAQLSRELYNETTPPTARQLAGIVLKNAISSGDSVIDREKRFKWQKVSPQVNACIKELVLMTLESRYEEAQNTACQVIAKVARVDLPLNNWEQLLPVLMKLVMNTATSSSQRKAAIRAIAYVCEDISLLAEELNTELLQPNQKNNIITTVTHAMKDLDSEIVLAGCKAFYHALYFARHNMTIQTERDYIFHIIGQCLKNVDLRIQHASWECVLQIVAENYDILDAYVADLGDHSILTIQNFMTINANEGIPFEEKRRTEAVALAAIEFWNTLCDIECMVALEEAKSVQSAPQSKQYIKRAQNVLLPVLFEAMTQQSSEEETECDEWTLAMAAGTCVSLCSQVLKNDILAQALPFVNNYFNATDWRRREASILVYGSIMEGPSKESLTHLIQQSFQQLCKGLDDKSVAVRETTAWTIGRVASFLTECIKPFLGSMTQKGLLYLLMSKLSDEPRVASYICFAIHEIARNLKASGDQKLLNPFFREFVDHLMQLTQRTDAVEHNLRASSLETLSELVEVVDDPACFPIMQAVLLKLHEILEKSFTFMPSPEINQLQGLICGCCTSLVNRLGKTQTNLNEIPQLFKAFSKIVDNALNASSANEDTNGLIAAESDPFNPSEARAESGSEEEDAILAIGALLQNYPGLIEMQLPELVQLTIRGLERPTNVRFCRACIGIVSEIAGAYNLKASMVAVQVKPLIEVLYKLLHDTNAPISLKPPLISTVGDLIVSMNTEFTQFLKPFLELLEHAASTKLTDGPSNEEWVEYFQELRDAVLEAYACILHVSNDQQRYQELRFHVRVWLNLVQNIATEEFFSLSNFTKAVEVTSDLVAVFRGELATVLVTAPFYRTMLEKGESSSDKTLQERVQFLKKTVIRCTTM